MRHLSMGLLVTGLLSCPALAQNQQVIVCPAHLSYCHYKPVLPRMTADDSMAEIRRELDRLSRLNDRAPLPFSGWDAAVARANGLPGR